MAGIDAGRSFIDWPLMEGQFVPPGALELTPVWINVFENPGLAQFNHRMLAYLVLIVAVLFVWRTGQASYDKVRAWGRRVGIVVVLQVILGIATVMHAAPLGLALAHQALALVLIGVLIHARFEIAYPAEQKIRA